MINLEIQLFNISLFFNHAERIDRCRWPRLSSFSFLCPPKLPFLTAGLTKKTAKGDVVCLSFPIFGIASPNVPVK
jgi:hypothetical protein